MNLRENRSLGAMTQSCVGDNTALLWTTRTTPAFYTGLQEGGWSFNCVVDGQPVHIRVHPWSRSVTVQPICCDRTHFVALHRVMHELAKVLVNDNPPFTDTAKEIKTYETDLKRLVHFATYDLTELLGP